MRETKQWPFVALLASVSVVIAAGPTRAQTSSLYVLEGGGQAAPTIENRLHNPLSPSIARVSLAAVRPPAPRQYGLHDLVTIIVRETTQNDSLASLSTEKEFEIDGEITQFPNLNLRKLLDFQLGPSDMRDGRPAVEMEMEKSFEGDGDYKRRDSFTTRITAEIIDVKPNGTLVLQARRHITTDSESMDMTLTGTCRKEDVTADNTVLSTQLFDLRLEKHHGGELKRATKRGIVTKFFDALFAF